MKLLRFLKYTVFITIVALVYIHMQVQIFDLAYKGKKKEKEIRDLSDYRNQVMYNILSLKSARNIGGNLLDEDSKMHFLDEQKIVKVHDKQLAGVSLPVTKLPEKKPSVLAKIFSFGSQAEARPIE